MKYPPPSIRTYFYGIPGVRSSGFRRAPHQASDQPARYSCHLPVPPPVSYCIREFVRGGHGGD